MTAKQAGESVEKAEFTPKATGALRAASPTLCVPTVAMTTRCTVTRSAIAASCRRLPAAERGMAPGWAPTDG